jgi:hypothetical protein
MAVRFEPIADIAMPYRRHAGALPGHSRTIVTPLEDPSQPVNAKHPVQIRSSKDMKKMDALYKYWEDPNYIVVRSGQPELTIAWLSEQTPETWHHVVMTWNYDYHDKVLSWVLRQENCDRGTAARVFDVEGLGHWLWDPKLSTDKDHLCSIILEQWHLYRSAEFLHHPQDHERLLAHVDKCLGNGLYANTPILEVARYSGVRDAQSMFESEDGKIVVAFDYRVKKNGIEISGKVAR